ncbi:MAG: PKD domain-containing protein [Flavobacteriales bacterium]|nr:PKD domain-containing protein [Flavobacteriales bacterium]
MKKIYALALAVFTSFCSFGQCVLEPFSLQKRIHMSDLVVEAEVIAQYSSWDNAGKFIYTVQTLKPYRVFKGALLNTDAFVIVTEGGRVGVDMLNVSPSLNLQVGEFGLFLVQHSSLRQKQLNLATKDVFIPTASLQSFIKYDELLLSAHSYFKTYDGIPLLHEEIERYIDDEPVLIQKPHWENGSIRPLAAPVITSWSADTVSSGTGTLLTINGANFGITRGNGKVEFHDANFGDGRFYTPSWGTSYKSWSNSKIEVYIPSRAGTGKVRITNNGGESTTTTSELFVKYSHLNVDYGATGIDTAYFQIDHVNTNNKGGYTWNMNRKFRLRNDAVNSFMRSLETWRCGSLMNWDVGDDTNVDEISRDQVNLVRFTKFTDSRLGVCYSWYRGCFQGSVIHWYASELDIEFDSSRNWYYGTGNPGTSRYDFQSVATHELGHGHQLGHVNDDTKIMHYSLRNGDRRVVLDQYDVEGAEFVREKSRVNNPCGPNRLVPINQEDCNITKPKALFTLSSGTVCPGIGITATNTSEGIVKTYAWNFGTSASPATSSTVGPHSVSYSTQGTKTVELIVTNDFGSDTATQIITVLPPIPSKPGSFEFTDSICQGIHSYRIDTVEFASEYLWELAEGGNIEGSAKLDSITVDWVSAGGPYTLSVKAVNSCGSSDTTARVFHVNERAKADFDTDLNGRIADFTFTGSGAESYQWKFGDGTESSEKDPSHTFPTAGSYEVELIVNNYCSSDTVSEQISTTFGTGIANLDDGLVRIYPNPAQSSFTVSIDEKDVLVKIRTVEGQLVRLLQLTPGASRILNVQDLATGIYLVELYAGEQHYRTTLIKE